MTMNFFCKSVIVAAVCGLSACAPPVETTPISAELPPVQPAVHAVGDIATQLNKISGKTETLRTMSVSPNRVEVINETTGCSYAFVPGAFAPSLEWKDCEGYTGASEISARDGQIYPLTVGAAESWTSKGVSNKGETWDNSQTCTVEGAVQVTTSAGPVDTYHVKCDSSSRVRNYYVSPENGRAVVFQSTSKTGGQPWHIERISFTPAAAAAS